MIKRKIIWAVAGALLLGLAIWIVYSIKTNTPQQTITKVLSLRDDNNTSVEDLNKYFTEDYKKIEKGARLKLNTSQYNLSESRKAERGVEVVLSVGLSDSETGELEDNQAAIFYLKRSGFFPFKFSYKIDYIREVNPVLTLTFPELMPKKQAAEADWGEAVDLGGHKIKFSDFKMGKESLSEDGLYEEGDLYYVSFLLEDLNNKNLKDLNLFFEIQSDDGICAQLQSPQDKLDGGKAVVKLSAETKDCQANQLIVKGDFEKDYKVNIK